MTRPGAAARIELAAGLALMIALCVWAGMRANFIEGLARLLRDPWGFVTLVDLYFGFAIVLAWIGWRERSIGRTALWAVLICGLGNIATAAYLLLALRQVRQGGDWSAFFLGRRP